MPLDYYLLAREWQALKDYYIYGDWEKASIKYDVNIKRVKRKQYDISDYARSDIDLCISICERNIYEYNKKGQNKSIVNMVVIL